MLHISRRRLVATLAATAALVRQAQAHGPTRQKVTQTVDVARTPDQIWAIVGDFDSIARWHPLIASSPADHGNDIGSKRTITLKAEGEPHFEEELAKYDAAAHSYHVPDREGGPQGAAGDELQRVVRSLRQPGRRQHRSSGGRRSTAATR